MVFLGLTLLSSALASSLVSATVIPSSRICTDLDIPVTVAAANGIYQFPPLTSNEEAVDLQFSLSRRDAPTDNSPSGYVNITGTYNINARFCTPKNGGEKSQTVQILTHGVGFTKSYWDPEVSRSNYSYVDAAIAAGYSVFSYDRLGNGKSSKPDPNDVVQSFTELAILKELTILIRTNELDLNWDKTTSKVIHVGHSYGSFLSNYIAAGYPELSDGIILTGYSHNQTWTLHAITSWGFEIARLQSPRKFGDFVSGYITWPTKWSNQFFFFKYPFFSKEALDYAEAGKQPVGLGTLNSLAAGNVFAADFTGPVLVITGQYDLPFCGGNCTGVLESSEELFPASSSFKSIVHPDAGHGINMHLNAQVAFKSMLDFLEESGL